MFNVHATGPRHGIPSRRNRRIFGAACSVALAVLLTGNVAAFQLTRDDWGSGPLVEPGPTPVLGSSQLLSLKLATTAGYNVLVFG